jgi:hypothetical protein
MHITLLVFSSLAVKGKRHAIVAMHELDDDACAAQEDLDSGVAGGWKKIPVKSGHSQHPRPRRRRLAASAKRAPRRRARGAAGIAIGNG